MLVLSRRPGEEILIGGQIVVLVTSIEGDVVRLGVKAPRDVPVDRREVAERKKKGMRDEG
jgi:carbon storage regulator